jgi:hypothetical protein
MSEATLTFRIVGPARYRGIAKAILIFFLGAAGGYAMVQEDQAALERAENLTLEQYTAEYQDYKAGLTAEAIPPAANYISVWAGLGIMFSLYEVIASGLAWLMRRATGTTGIFPTPPRPGPVEGIGP